MEVSALFGRNVRRAEGTKIEVSGFKPTLEVCDHNRPQPGRTRFTKNIHLLA